jgi:3-hydroxyisobutyrate dehydrogenase-like beta-hydroxyacid dehydrogenase
MERIARVGFVGLGIMGSRMAKNLARKGFEVLAWNRTPGKAEALAPDGVKAVATPREIAAGTDAFCTCVADPPALREVVHGKDGLFAGARSGQLFIDFSTVSPELSRELEAASAAKGIDYVEAPVTGSKNGAEKGTLLLMVGAKPAAFERAQPVFAAVGETAIHCGEVGSGSQVKLTCFGNFDLRDKNQRPGRNPKTGEEIPIIARRVVTFRPGQKLKARVESYAGTPEQ